MTSIRAGIIGWPVTHSLSPVLHGYWLKEYGIDGEMLRLPARPEEFADVIERVRREGFAGVNVTVPHKEAAFAMADRHDAAARDAGAANLMIFHPDGSIEGRNTDAMGFAESVKENIGRLDGKSVTLLGAGGATRGAVLALEQLGAARIHILNRTEARAHDLAAELGPKVKAKLVPGPLDSWVTVAKDTDFLANTTSAGISGNLALDLSLLPPNVPFLDIVYKPLRTDLMKRVAEHGNKTIDGLGMLMHQAVPSFEAFFGIRPQVTPGLRAALEKALA